MLKKAVFLLMEELQLEAQMMILYVPPWIGGLLINVTMELAVGVELLFSIW